MGTRTKAIPVTIRGKKFPSMQAAADHYKVGITAISHARRRGTLDKVGLGGNQYFKRKSVTIRGTTYGSHKAAAKALACSPVTISRRAKAGTLDQLALGNRRRRP